MRTLIAAVLTLCDVMIKPPETKLLPKLHFLEDVQHLSALNDEQHLSAER